jgi:hypothetical protein
MKIESQRKYNICDLTKDEFSIIRNALDFYAKDDDVDWKDRKAVENIHKLLFEYTVGEDDD